MSTTTMEPRATRAEGRAGRSALALVGALVPAAMIAAIARSPLPLAALPAVSFGVPAMTAPALYVALGLRGAAPPMAAVAGALGRALVALALVQLGLAAPVGFLVATATPATALALVGGATLVSSAVAAIALDLALAGGEPQRRHAAILWTWIAITAVIAARLHLEVVAGVTS